MKLNSESIQTGESTYCPEDNKLRLYVGRVPRPEYDALRAENADLLAALEDASRQIENLSIRLAKDVSPAHADYISKARASESLDRVLCDARAAIARATQGGTK